MIAIGSDQSAVSEFQIGAFGMGLVTDTALTAGIGSIPDPVTNPDSDIWFLYQSFAQRFLFKDASGFEGNDWVTYQFDSKAKRIVHDDESVAIVGANAHATNGLTVVFHIRMLQMLRGSG